MTACMTGRIDHFHRWHDGYDGFSHIPRVAHAYAYTVYMEQPVIPVIEVGARSRKVGFNSRNPHVCTRVRACEEMPK